MIFQDNLRTTEAHFEFTGPYKKSNKFVLVVHNDQRINIHQRIISTIVDYSHLQRVFLGNENDHP